MELNIVVDNSFPNEKGFSATNLKYMKRWYLYYCDHVAIRQQPADELAFPMQKKAIGENRQQVVDDLNMPEIFRN